MLLRRAKVNVLFCARYEEMSLRSSVSLLRTCFHLWKAVVVEALIPKLGLWYYYSHFSLLVLHWQDNVFCLAYQQYFWLACWLSLMVAFDLSGFIIFHFEYKTSSLSFPGWGIFCDESSSLQVIAIDFCYLWHFSGRVMWLLKFSWLSSYLMYSFLLILCSSFIYAENSEKHPVLSMCTCLAVMSTFFTHIISMLE